MVLLISFLPFLFFQSHLSSPFHFLNCLISTFHFISLLKYFFLAKLLMSIRFNYRQIQEEVFHYILYYLFCYFLKTNGSQEDCQLFCWFPNTQFEKSQSQPVTLDFFYLFPPAFFYFFHWFLTLTQQSRIKVKRLQESEFNWKSIFKF